MSLVICACKRIHYASAMTNWALEYRQSMKAPDAEDKIDLLFYRPAGFVIAKAAWALRLTPTHLTLLGMLAGISAGYFFYLERTAFTLAAAILLFLFSGVLDSADGQLARISKQSTPFGLVLDGLCDNIVFTAVYVGCILPLIPYYGWWIWLLAFPAGFCHSYQSAILDFYNREYLFYTGTGKDSHYWNPLLTEARESLSKKSSLQDRIFWRLRYSWLWQQQLLSTRTPQDRINLRRSAWETPGFRDLYQKLNQPLLHLWRPLGANIHTLGIIFFASLQRFDLYLILIDLTLLNAWMFLAWRMQKRADLKLMRALPG